MPQRVDHDQRRRAIAGAVWRIAADRGLDSVRMRDVAAEAGVSLRLVQYYFETKHNLLVLALRYLCEDTERRARERIEAQAGQSARGVLRGVLTGLLPLDTESEFALRVRLAYFSRSYREPGVFPDRDSALEDLVTQLLEQGEPLPGIRPLHEADLLVSGIAGLGFDILHGRQRTTAVLATLDYHLDRIFGPAGG